MARVAMEGIGNIKEVTDTIIDEILNGSVSGDLTSEIYRGSEGFEIILLVFEKYYMRISSRASLSVLIINNKGNITVDSVGGGAGQGPLFKMSWGAEEHFAEAIVKPLEKLGFVSK